MRKSFVSELHGEWSEFADECVVWPSRRYRHPAAYEIANVLGIGERPKWRRNIV